MDYENPKKIGNDMKKHIVAHDLCIGKRTIKDYSIDRATDCGEILENQLLSLMNVSDFSMASTDPDCNSTNARSCDNYNYLYRVASNTWTPNSVLENTYEVFYISNGMMEYSNASEYNNYNIILYIDGDESGITGKGTLEDPYVMN